MQSAVSWFEIPAEDLDRAVRFYECLLDTRLRREKMGPMEMAILPYTEPGTGGAIASGPEMIPSTAGAIIYLQCADIREPLARLAGAGGAVVMPRTHLNDDVGYIALIRDSEGNRVGLHSMK